MIQDSQLVFQSHITEAMQNVNRGAEMITYLSEYVSQDVLEQICKLYVRPFLVIGDVICYKYDPQMHLNI